MADRKAFEEPEFGCMWQADTCYFPYITENGKSRRVYCVMIIDDHSRLLVGGGLFYNDNAYGFQKVLKQAVAAYGIPDKLLVDNGAPYRNEQLSMICVSIGTVLIHTKARDGASKGKSERHWRTCRETWLNGLDIGSITSLGQFNGMLRDYMRRYNTSYHGGIGTTPMERYEATKDHPKIPASPEWLEECFLNRITRKVRKDSTITVDNVCYDVPLQFISTHVEIRFVPDDMERAFLLHEGIRFPIRKTDRNENSRTKRNHAVSIDYSKAGGVS